jgi:hypothetical protein
MLVAFDASVAMANTTCPGIIDQGTLLACSVGLGQSFTAEAHSFVIISSLVELTKDQVVGFVSGE